MQTLEDCSSLPQIKPVVIGVIGGPGAGKGTQCELVCQKFKVSHISIGHVLRAEMANQSSPHREVIRKNMLAGTFAPKEVTMAVIQSHMNKAAELGITMFVTDGFPRHLAQLHYFEREIVPLRTVILLQCSEETMADRLLSRQRFDDNAESIRNRLHTFNTITSEVVDLMRQRVSLDVIDAEQPVEAVSKGITDVFLNIGENIQSTPGFTQQCK